jgi:peptidyl-prolyl cis-trans isomerase A (cyclophilin A)
MLCAVIALALVQTPAPSPDPAVPSPTPRPTPTGPTVVITTSLGPIKVVLNKEQSPITVDNFLKYARAGFYDGTIFHRVIPGFMVQGGGMTPDMQEKPTQAPIRNEARNGIRNSRGTLAMARTNDPNSATSQFFINVRDNHSLDFGIRGAGYAVFAEVVEGMDVVDKIVGVPTAAKGPHENVPVTPVVIRSVREAGGEGTAPRATRPAGPAASPSASPRPRASPSPTPRPSGSPRKP